MPKHKNKGNSYQNICSNCGKTGNRKSDFRKDERFSEEERMNCCEFHTERVNRVCYTCYLELLKGFNNLSNIGDLYEEITQNKYPNGVTITICDTYDCNFNEALGIRCLNEQTYYECHDANEGCLNHRILDSKWIETDIIFGVCGYGLKTCVNLKKNQFLMEYVGVAIMKDQYENTPKKYGHGLYEEKSYVIDASVSGNEARFINHSCDPNCRMECWIVKGVERLAIYADKNIKKGEELTFNYQWNNSETKCFCESDKCKGYY